MLKLALGGTILLALMSTAAASGPQDGKRNAVAGNAAPKSVRSAATDDVRGRVVDIQQALDRILAETTPAPVGTSGAARPAVADGHAAGANAVAIDRGRLLQLRRQLDALLASLK